MTPNFYFIFETSKSLSVCARSLKKIYRVENFCANVLKVGLQPEGAYYIIKKLITGNKLGQCSLKKSKQQHSFWQ